LSKKASLPTPPFVPPELPGGLVFQPKTEAMQSALKKLNSPALAAVRVAHEVFSCRLGCGLSTEQKIALLKERLDRLKLHAANDFHELLFILTTPGEQLAKLSTRQIRAEAWKKFDGFHPASWQPFADAIAAFYLLKFLSTRISLTEFAEEWERTA
jgi:hypothetical protein